MTKEFFKAVMKDGRTIDFNNQCNVVDYGHDSVCVFLHTVDEKNSIVLAVIPYESIISVERDSEYIA